MQSIASRIYLEEDQELIELIEYSGKFKAAYPPELLATRRANFITQVEQWEKTRASYQPHSKKDVIQPLDELAIVLQVSNQRCPHSWGTAAILHFFPIKEQIFIKGYTKNTKKIYVLGTVALVCCGGSKTQPALLQEQED